MRTSSIVGLAILTLTLVPPTAHAQSSGNFSAAGTGASCVIGAGGALSGGTVLTSFTASLSTGSGNGTTLDIRPSLVTGLFTRTKIDTSVSSASADVGLQVCITVDGSGDTVLPTDCVVFLRSAVPTGQQRSVFTTDRVHRRNLRHLHSDGGLRNRPDLQ